MRQSLFKKHSKLQNFDEIFHYAMTRCRNVKLGGFRQYQSPRTVFKKKNIEQNCFKKCSKFKKFQSINFTLTWSNEGKVNSVQPYMTYSKELQQKMKMLS